MAEPIRHPPQPPHATDAEPRLDRIGCPRPPTPDNQEWGSTSLYDPNNAARKRRRTQHPRHGHASQKTKPKEAGVAQSYTRPQLPPGECLPETWRGADERPEISLASAGYRQTIERPAMQSPEQDYEYPVVLPSASTTRRSRVLPCPPDPNRHTPHPRTSDPPASGGEPSPYGGPGTVLPITCPVAPALWRMVGQRLPRR